MTPGPAQPAKDDGVIGERVLRGGSDIRRVIVGVDDSEGGIAAVKDAVVLAESRHAQLVAVRAWALGLPRHGGRRHRHLSHPHVVLYFNGYEQRSAARALTERVIGEAVGRMPVSASIATPAGDPGVVLTDIASQPGDVLVIGRWPHVSARGVVHGSVTSYCVRHARCPVIVVPAAGAEAGRQSA